MDCSPPSSSVHRILQARILEWVAISFCMGSSWCRGWTRVSYIAGIFFTIWATGKTLRLTAAAAAKSLQSCPTLCSPVDSSPAGSPNPGILQARVLEWGDIAFSLDWLLCQIYYLLPDLCISRSKIYELVKVLFFFLQKRNWSERLAQSYPFWWESKGKFHCFVLVLEYLDLKTSKLCQT